MNFIPNFGLRLWLLGLLAFALTLVTAQPEELLSSTLGYKFTPKGRFHVLVIVVRYTNEDLINSESWPDSSEPGQLPEAFRGEVNPMYCTSPDSVGVGHRHRNLSDYYWVMSQGKFLLTGETYPVQVPVSYIPEKSGNFSSRQRAMNRAAVEWIAEHDPDFDWSRFDLRTNGASYRRDNSGYAPDSMLDYVFFIHRAPGSSGVSTATSIDIPHSPYRIRDGQTGIRNFVDPEHNWTFFVHEMAHNLYHAPHMMGSNQSDGVFFYTQLGWGMMSDWVAPLFQANAWERWWLGWQEVQTVETNGQYRLGDLLTEHDAIRIRVPGTEQYLWLENHQMKDHWDQKIFYNQYRGDYRHCTPTAPGLYAYVVDSVGSDRSRPRLNPFNLRHVNSIRTYNGQGNFDYELLPERIAGKGSRWPTFRRGAANPIMGYNDFVKLRYDYDGDGVISVGFRHGNLDHRKQEEKGIFVTEVDGEIRLTGNQTGDAHDALVPGDVVGLSGKFPVLNYAQYRRQDSAFDPMLLNGLRIEVLEQLPGGHLRLDIRFDAWTLRRDQRWCGPLRLEASTGTAPLRIAPKVHLTLDLSGTPDRQRPHPVTGIFVNPTYWVIADARRVELGRKAQLTVQRHSRLKLTDQAELRLGPKAGLRIQADSELRLEDESRLVLARGARLIIAPGATVSEESLSRVSGAGKVVDRRRP